MKKIIEKCPSCGNNMRFAPDTSDLYCEHCGGHTKFEIHNYENIKKDLNLGESIKTITKKCNCPNCGAINEINEHSVSYICQYCNTPIVLNEFKDEIDALVPFQISKERAKQCYQKWLRKKWFAPSSLKKLAKMDLLEGHYIPVWAFDADTYTKYSGKQVETINVSREVGGKIMMETRYEVTPFRGEKRDNWRNILVTGNSAITNFTLEHLEPFDYTTLRLYAPEFLLGFCLDTYSIPAKTGYENAQNEIKGYIRDSIVRTKKGRVEDLKMDIQYSSEKQARYLVPVWTSLFNYKNKKYRFYINGCTGEVYGSYPLSKWKVAFAIIFGIIIAFGITYLVLTTS